MYSFGDEIRMKFIKNFIALISVIFLVACSDAVDEKSKEQQEVAVSPSTATQRPNVVFILVDDMGFGDVGYNGSEIATPNLDQMANEGVRLDRNYVYPICSPTRAALMTGQSPLRYGIDGPMSDDTGLPLDLRIMPEYFKDLGYQTYMIGKWHLGLGNTDYWPISRGFDYHYGFLGGWVDFYTHVYGGGLDWQRDGMTVREEGHATDLFTVDAKRIIKSREKDSPFFMYLAYNAPHSPLQTIPAASGLNNSVEQGDRFVYAEMATQADTAIGEVIATLEAEGILDETLIIFSSDNGGALDLGASNGDLRGAKGSAYEGGMRVPGVVWWAGHVDGGRVLEQPIAVHDWLPTLMDAVGGDAADVVDAYGQSMWAAIANNTQVERAITTIGVVSSKAAIDWPWKFVRDNGRGPNAVKTSGLFNVLEDPYEKNDLSAQNPEKAAALVAVLDSLPVVESKRDLGPNPESFFRAADSTDWDYEVRVKETHEPWADKAVKGKSWAGEN
jgi:arylsulfatase A-like enzyme